MRQALICFENEERAKTTVVCAGDMILTKTRENINQVKLKLLDRMDKAHPQTQQPPGKQMLLNTQINESDTRSTIYMTQQEAEETKQQAKPSAPINYDYSSKTNIMLISLTDFCPYFCSTEDLNGKQLKDLKKREIMSPFNVHFNVTNMIELVRVDSPHLLSDLMQSLVFRKFKKTEISLDWTLLKLSFHDLQIFKQITDHNVELIKQRSEKMAYLAEEEASALDGLSQADKSSVETSSDYYSEDETQFKKETPIGPQPFEQSLFRINEPSLHDSASESGFEVLAAEEEKSPRMIGRAVLRQQS